MANSEYIYEREIGPLHYYVKKEGQRFSLWLNGCCIGKPRKDGNIWEFKPKILIAAKRELVASAKRELQRRINDRQREIDELNEALQTI